MLLPNRSVVRRGGKGTFMLLLCHGSAAVQVDGITVGSPLGPGDCIGTENFFGLRSKYVVNVHTLVVCHFRQLSSEHRMELLPRHPAERERLEQLRQQVQQD